MNKSSLFTYTDDIRLNGFSSYFCIARNVCLTVDLNS